MVKVGFSSSFKRAFKKRIKGNRNKEKAYFQKLELFISNPFHPLLRTHKLSGKLQMLWSFSIEYDLRVVFYFINNKEVIFEDIGTHNEVY